MDLEKEKKVIVKAAKKADKILLSYFNKKTHIKEKPNNSLVCEADLEANDAIIKIIKKNFPAHNILTEEEDYIDNNSEFKWVIDPLDGTHNFVNGVHIFGTSIALLYKNRPVLGLLNFPMLKLTALAEYGHGAYLNGEKLHVSKKDNLNHAFIMYEFSYPSRSRMVKFYSKFINTRADIRNFGAASYGLVLVAAGKADAFVIMSTNEWDIAAGFLIIEEAGGIITNDQGKKYTFNDKSFVAANKKIHKKILKFVK
jgi:myo-inositol-1(or 4)-monophosphatase